MHRSRQSIEQDLALQLLIILFPDLVINHKHVEKKQRWRVKLALGAQCSWMVQKISRMRIMHRSLYDRMIIYRRKRINWNRHHANDRNDKVK